MNDFVRMIREALGEAGKAQIDKWADARERQPKAQDGEGEGETSNPLMPEVVEGRLRLHLYTPIGDSDWFASMTGPTELAQALRGRGDMPVDLYIDSPGGDVFMGQAMSALLERHAGEVVAHADGLAASAASVLMMAADRRLMRHGAQVMIHNAWSYALGNAAELRQVADQLDKVDGDIAAVYARVGKRDQAEFAELMNAETWFTAEEAREAGLVDEIAGEEEKEAEEAPSSMRQALAFARAKARALTLTAPAGNG